MFWHFHETEMTLLQVDYICISESSRSMCAAVIWLPWKMGEDDVIMGSPPSGELSSIRSSGLTVLADAVLLLQQIETTLLLQIHLSHLTSPIFGRVSVYPSCLSTEQLYLNRKWISEPFITIRKRSWGKVMFSQVYVCSGGMSTHLRGEYSPRQYMGYYRI